MSNRGRKEERRKRKELHRGSGDFTAESAEDAEGKRKEKELGRRGGGFTTVGAEGEDGFPRARE